MNQKKDQLKNTLVLKDLFKMEQHVMKQIVLKII